MKKLMSITLAMAMTLSLSGAAFAWHYDEASNELGIEQKGAFNTAIVEQDIDSYGFKGLEGSNEADVEQCGLLNFAKVYQRAVKGLSNEATIKQVGFANKACAYQH